MRYLFKEEKVTRIPVTMMIEELRWYAFLEIALIPFSLESRTEYIQWSLYTQW